MKSFLYFCFVVLLPIMFVVLGGCSRNVDYIKKHASERFSQLGYDISGYEGYELSFKGGYVWYELKRKDSPGVLYTAALARWEDDLDIYNAKVISGNQFNVLDDK